MRGSKRAINREVRGEGARDKGDELDSVGEGTIEIKGRQSD